MSEVRNDHEVCSNVYQERMARMEQKTKLRTARHSQHHHNHNHHYRHHHNRTAAEEDLEKQQHEDDLRTLCWSVLRLSGDRVRFEITPSFHGK